MRKMRHDKARACGLCKPHKRRGAVRWRRKDEDRIRRSDTEMREAREKIC